MKDPLSRKGIRNTLIFKFANVFDVGVCRLDQRGITGRISRDGYFAS
jgi:hypothetical protein